MARQKALNVFLSANPWFWGGLFVLGVIIGLLV